MNRPTIPKYSGPHPRRNGMPVKFYVHWDEETGRAYETEVQEDGSEKFYRWRPDEFCVELEKRIKEGKFGKVEKYRWG